MDEMYHMVWGLRGSTQFLIFENFYMVFRSKVCIEKSFFIENLKMDIGQFLYGYYCIWSNLFHLGVC